ncbi:hypothetical protein SAY86_014497 [Trapa natans]|uniref:Uncharacterized protein n=1 Tax=Trapa natans TaxID=22666 RepID=A0AAN7KST4_TRANT|nr:hypothetical protein SAY86_014497 [Trapa natans]
MDDSSLSNGQSQVPGGGYASDKDVTVDDAIAYAKEVRHTLQPRKYKMFMKILNDFMAQRTDMAGVVARVKELFKDHSHLIPKFSDFLPKEYQAIIYDDGEVIDE